MCLSRDVNLFWTMLSFPYLYKWWHESWLLKYSWKIAWWQIYLHLQDNHMKHKKVDRADELWKMVTQVPHGSMSDLSVRGTALNLWQQMRAWWNLREGSTVHSSQQNELSRSWSRHRVSYLSPHWAWRDTGCPLKRHLWQLHVLLLPQPSSVCKEL